MKTRTCGQVRVSGPVGGVQAGCKGASAAQGGGSSLSGLCLLDMPESFSQFGLRETDLSSQTGLVRPGVGWMGWLGAPLPPTLVREWGELRVHLGGGRVL